MANKGFTVRKDIFSTRKDNEIRTAQFIHKLSTDLTNQVNKIKVVAEKIKIAKILYFARPSLIKYIVLAANGERGATIPAFYSKCYFKIKIHIRD